MDFRSKEEIKRLTRVADVNARDISNLKATIQRLSLELDIINKKLENIEKKLMKE
ncbi:MAG: hypothetical protein H8E17_15675 [Deltaproteobacteria bacterium]|nr:hypothetical protein [Deltaproteobacteria bacterium]